MTEIKALSDFGSVEEGTFNNYRAGVYAVQHDLVVSNSGHSAMSAMDYMGMYLDSAPGEVGEIESWREMTAQERDKASEVEREVLDLLFDDPGTFAERVSVVFPESPLIRGLLEGDCVELDSHRLVAERGLARAYALVMSIG